MSFISRAIRSFRLAISSSNASMALFNIQRHRKKKAQRKRRPHGFRQGDLLLVTVSDGDFFKIKICFSGHLWALALFAEFLGLPEWSAAQIYMLAPHPPTTHGDNHDSQRAGCCYKAVNDHVQQVPHSPALRLKQEGASGQSLTKGFQTCRAWPP